MSILGQALGNQKARKKNDFYPTIDPRCVPPLLAAMAAVGDGPRYAEPCAGAGDLIHLLAPHGLDCQWGLELEPQGDLALNRWPIGVGNALMLTEADCEGVDCFITNPAWSRPLLHLLIRHLARLRPTWLLFDSSWAYTKQATPFSPLCTDIAAVGRLKFFPPPGRLLWLPGESPAAYAERTRKRRAKDPPDDCAWYRFDKQADPAAPRFHFPVARELHGGLL